jgi:hypothetical protein
VSAVIAGKQQIAAAAALALVGQVRKQELESASVQIISADAGDVLLRRNL